MDSLIALDLLCRVYNESGMPKDRNPIRFYRKQAILSTLFLAQDI
jgi:hypothetical protein